jgi:hypothetical protein
MLRHLQLKDPAFGFMLALEKAKRGAAGRRGESGVEIVTDQRERNVFDARPPKPRKR